MCAHAVQFNIHVITGTVQDNDTDASTLKPISKSLRLETYISCIHKLQTVRAAVYWIFFGPNLV